MISFSVFPRAVCPSIRSPRVLALQLNRHSPLPLPTSPPLLTPRPLRRLDCCTLSVAYTSHPLPPLSPFLTPRLLHRSLPAACHIHRRPLCSTPSFSRCLVFSFSFVCVCVCVFSYPLSLRFHFRLVPLLVQFSSSLLASLGSRPTASSSPLRLLYPRISSSPLLLSSSRVVPRSLVFVSCSSPAPLFSLRSYLHSRPHFPGAAAEEKFTRRSAAPLSCPPLSSLLSHVSQSLQHIVNNRVSIGRRGERLR